MRLIGGSAPRPAVPAIWAAFAAQPCGHRRPARLAGRAIRRDMRVAAYGAAAKGNTLLNSAGVGTADISTSSTGARTSKASFCPARTCRSSTPGTLTTTSPITYCCSRGTSATRSPSRCPTCVTGAAGSSSRFRTSRCFPDLCRARSLRRLRAHPGAGARLARLVRAHIRPRRAREARPPPRGRAGEHVIQRTTGNVARSPPPAPAARGGEARPLRGRCRLRCRRRPAAWLPTQLSWVGVELSSERRNAIFLPEGLAHGFLTLVDECELEYLISTPYDAAAATGVRWDDPAVGIEWPFRPEVLSERDAGFPDLDRGRLAAEGPAALA